MAARARVQLTIEIDLQDHWGDDCSAGQIRKQALDGAKDALRQGFIVDHMRTAGSQARLEARIIGEPKVTMILLEK